jgi:hypothetical protein
MAGIGSNWLGSFQTASFHSMQAGVRETMERETILVETLDSTMVSRLIQSQQGGGASDKAGKTIAPIMIRTWPSIGEGGHLAAELPTKRFG